MDEPRRLRALQRILFALVAVSTLYFAQGGGANQNSRYDLTRAIVEDGTFRIDRYAHNTLGDLAVRDGHRYSDKAPGLALAAVPVYALSRVVVPPSPPQEAPSTLELHVMTFAVIGLASAAAAACLLELLASLGLGLGAASVAVVAWSLGTHAFAYATLFVAHQLVASLIVISMTLSRRARDATGRRAHALLLVAGLLAGWATLSEYPAVVLSLVALVYAVYACSPRRAWPFVVGAAIPALILALYNTRCFGSPFSLGYTKLADAQFQKVIATGVMGFTRPTLDALSAVLFSEWRGLLPIAPFLVLVVPGALLLLPRERTVTLGCALTLLVGLVMNASYVRWDGGAAMGPRHFVPYLPFAVPLVAAALDEVASQRGARRAASASLAGLLIAVSIAICTMSVAVMPEFPDVEKVLAPFPPPALIDMRAPVRNFVVPMFLRGKLSEKGLARSGAIGSSSLNPGHEHDAENVGEALGLRGLASLAPLFGVWIALGLAAVRRAHPSNPQNSSDRGPASSGPVR